MSGSTIGIDPATGEALFASDNRRATLLDSTPRTATASSDVQNNGSWRGAHIVIDVTAATASPSVVPTVEGYDALSGKYFTLLTGTALTGTGTTVLKVYPGIGAGTFDGVPAGGSNDVLPTQWRITMTHADSDSITYSVAAHLIA